MVLDSPTDHLIISLDVRDIASVSSWIERLYGYACCFRLAASDFSNHADLFHILERLKELRRRVLIDIRAYDTPESTRAAILALRRFEVDVFSVANRVDTMHSAVAVADRSSVVTTTVLTTISETSFSDRSASVRLEDVVVEMTRNALQAGCDGVITSGVELPRLRREFGGDFLAIVPGIRDTPSSPDAEDNQARTVTIEGAFLAGADAVVIGRPILGSPSPEASVVNFLDRIGAVLSTSKTKTP